MVYELEDVLQESSLETVLENGKQAVILVTGRECQETLAKLGIFLENEISLSKINFCKLETQQEYLYGTLAIPRFLDITGSRYQMSLFITRQLIVIADDSDFSIRLLQNIRMRKVHQGVNKGRFLFNFVTEFLERDYEILDSMEHTLMSMEEEASSVKQKITRKS